MEYVSSECEWLRDVPVTGFSNKAVVIVSRLSRVLREVNGSQLALQDPLLGQKLLEEVERSKDDRLTSLFNELIIELQRFAETRGLPRYRGTVAEKVAPVLSNPNNAPLTYRGSQILVEPKIKSAEQSDGKSNTRTYRGVEY